MLQLQSTKETITTTNKIQLLEKRNNKERKTTGKWESRHHYLAEPDTLKSFKHYSPINKQKVVEVDFFCPL